MKLTAITMLAAAVLAQQLPIETDENQDMGAVERKETEPTWSITGDVHLGEVLNLFGISNFVCSNPTPFKSFDVTKLAGAWF